MRYGLNQSSFLVLLFSVFCQESMNYHRLRVQLRWWEGCLDPFILDPGYWCLFTLLCSRARRGVKLYYTNAYLQTKINQTFWKPYVKRYHSLKYRNQMCAVFISNWMLNHSGRGPLYHSRKRFVLYRTKMCWDPTLKNHRKPNIYINKHGFGQKSAEDVKIGKQRIRGLALVFSRLNTTHNAIKSILYTMSREQNFGFWN